MTRQSLAMPDDTTLHPAAPLPLTGIALTGGVAPPVPLGVALGVHAGAPYGDILAEAPWWLGTPYHHRAAIRGQGCDCVGLLAGIALACKRLPADWTLPLYSPEWHWHQEHERLVEVLTGLGCLPLPLGQTPDGAIVLFRNEKALAHAGIMMPDGMLLHAQRRPGIPNRGRVELVRLTPQRLATLEAAYGWPAVRV